MDLSLINKTNIPKHVAIIMDGNGRWAKKQNLPRISGHKKGVQSVREIVEVASSIGISTLTLFTFSSENWERPTKEVTLLMKLLISSIRKELNDLLENNIQFHYIGELNNMDTHVMKELEIAKQKTSINTGMILNLALSYGSRQEILNAVKLVHIDYSQNKKDINSITENEFSRYLYTSGFNDPDLLIRTGGDYRLSNFLLWQIAYTELIINNKYWPDFSKSDFISTIIEFQSRDRRFGRLDN